MMMLRMVTITMMLMMIERMMIMMMMIEMMMMMTGTRMGMCVFDQQVFTAQAKKARQCR